MIKKVIVLFILIFFVACARKGSPGGGPKDITPPKFLRAKPDTFAVNVSKDLKEIKIDFNEYIILKDAFKQVIFSPPLETVPTIYPTANKARKYILVKLEEPLKANTTYNINFGESVQDLNEGNKLSLFNYVISTGDQIDSLSVKGSTKQALKNEINPNTVFALYKKDTAKLNLKEKPYYVTKIDSSSNFNFKYLHEGSYYLVGFTDDNNNLRYDNEELLAFADSLINPKDSLQFNLVLAENIKDFKIKSKKQTNEGEVEFTFQGSPKEVSLSPLSESFPLEYKFVHRPYSDSAYIYFNAEELQFENNKQRLSFVLTQNKENDTLNILYDRKEKTKFELNLKNPIAYPNKKTYFYSNLALSKINSDSIAVKEDSLPINFKAEIDSLNPKRLNLNFPVTWERKYQVTFFPGAIKTMTDKKLDTLSYSLQSKDERSYGNFKITIKNPPKDPFFMQLLDSENKVLNSYYSRDSVFYYKNLEPKKYTFRILVDENKNKHWDKSDISNFKQAEKTYIYNKIIEIRAFWDVDEIWTLPE